MVIFCSSYSVQHICSTHVLKSRTKLVGNPPQLFSICHFMTSFHQQLKGLQFLSRLSCNYEVQDNNSHFLICISGISIFFSMPSANVFVSSFSHMSQNVQIIRKKYNILNLFWDVRKYIYFWSMIFISLRKYVKLYTKRDLKSALLVVV